MREQIEVLYLRREVGADEDYAALLNMLQGLFSKVNAYHWQGRPPGYWQMVAVQWDGFQHGARSVEIKFAGVIARARRRAEKKTRTRQPTSANFGEFDLGAPVAVPKLFDTPEAI